VSLHVTEAVPMTNRFPSLANALFAAVILAAATATANEPAREAKVEVAESAEGPLPTATAPKITGVPAPLPNNPPGAQRGSEQAAPVVKACVGPDGNLVREPVIVETSGFPEIDAAAIKIAKANRYSPAANRGAAPAESCVKFRVKFVVKPD
jgi:hypothetical protein